MNISILRWKTHVSYFLRSLHELCRWKTALVRILKILFSTTSKESSKLLQEWMWIVTLSAEAVHSVALWTRTLSQVWDGLGMCAVCTEAVHSVALWARTVSQVFGHVCSMNRSSPFRSTLSTNGITGLDMCAVWTEAVHSVALWARTVSQVWTCVQYEPKQSIP